MIQRNVRDTVLLSGWLFADLLLGLMVIFMVSIPGVQARPPVIPTLFVSPTIVSPDTPVCGGGTQAPQCILIVGETPGSLGPVAWTASSDMSDNIIFTPSTGTLSPGQTAQVHVSSLPCQNGSLTFSGSRDATAVIVSWHCTPAPKPPERLDFTYRQFTLNVSNVNALLAHTPGAVSEIENQVMSEQALQGRRVGLAIVYAGAPTPADISTAQSIAQEIYAIFKGMKNSFPPLYSASYYDSLFLLGGNPNVVAVQVYLFEQ
jgi:hypothetical protein